MKSNEDQFQPNPAKVTLTKGKREAWCSCGKSLKQPFCDGSHRDTDFKPLKFTPEEDQEVWLCQCKLTKNPPFCDGSHTRLTPNE